MSLETKQSDDLAVVYDTFMRRMSTSLVEYCVDRSYDGHVPDNREAFIAEIVELFRRKSEGLGPNEAVRACAYAEFEKYVRESVDTVELSKKSKLCN